MSLPYKKHFPSDWTTEKIEENVTDIATNPNSRWIQITGQDFPLCHRPHKFIADGQCEGKQIRVVLEPEGRGILTAYLLD
jgi:hypothetical protein